MSLPHALLVASLVPLALGPFVWRGLQRKPAWREGLDGFVLASIGVLVVGHLVPLAYEVVGAGALAAMAAGLLLPTLVERVRRVSAARTHAAAILIGYVGLAAHALVDGVALSMASSDVAGGVGMALAVVLHRLPVALALWWLVAPRLGDRVATAVLVGVAVATVLGFAFGERWTALAADATLALFNAFVAGMLIHIAVHSGTHEHAHAMPAVGPPPGGDHVRGRHEHHQPQHAHGQHAHREAGHDHAHDRHAHREAGHDHAHDQHAHREAGHAQAHDNAHAHHEPAHAHADDHAHAHHAHGHAAGCAACAHDVPDVHRLRLAETFGALLGVGVALLVGRVSGHGGHAHAHESGFTHRLLDLTLEAAPALLLGFVLAGAASVWLPAASVGWLRRGGSVAQAMRGMAFGLPLPVCSCGVVPMYRSLVKAGAPATASMAFLVATPEIGIEAIVLSVPFLGWELTGLRVAAAAAVALAAGVLVGRGVAPTPAAAASPPAGERGRTAQLRDALQYGFVELVDDTAPWIIAGLLVAAAFAPGALVELLATVPRSLHVVVFAAAGVPLYICASGATPIAAALIAAGVSPGAGVAFLLAGPATNVTTYGVVASLHGRARAAAFMGVVVGAAVIAGWGVDALMPAVAAAPTHDAHSHRAAWLGWATASAMAAAFAASLLRRGPRAFVSSLVAADGHD